MTWGKTKTGVNTLKKGSQMRINIMALVTHQFSSAASLRYTRNSSETSLGLLWDSSDTPLSLTWYVSQSLLATWAVNIENLLWNHLG